MSKTLPYLFPAYSHSVQAVFRLFSGDLEALFISSEENCRGFSPIPQAIRKRLHKKLTLYGDLME
jgi:hypothetical protein